ncbi:MAG TPA: helix-turn-helix transcriptional regulator [Flavisolibacter sp.]|nr:helix-turn-helix transcriptional regulator [Flavisolibacter sp.]
MDATGKKIVAVRKQKGLTQEELAEKAGITVRTIQRIESGETIPRAYTIRAIAEALELDPASITGQPEEMVGLIKSDRSADQLYLINLLCFSYLVIPLVHAVIPYMAWKRANDTVYREGRDIVYRQIWWTVALFGLMLATVAYNLIVVKAQMKGWKIHYLWPFFAMYIINAFIIVRDHQRIKSGK